MRVHTKLRAFEPANEVALLIDMTFPATNQKLWRPGRFWALASIYAQKLTAFSLQPNQPKQLKYF
jgi:hypothetical protein